MIKSMLQRRALHEVHIEKETELKDKKKMSEIAHSIGMGKSDMELSAFCEKEGIKIPRCEPFYPFKEIGLLEILNSIEFFKLKLIPGMKLAIQNGPNKQEINESHSKKSVVLFKIKLTDEETISLNGKVEGSKYQLFSHYNGKSGREWKFTFQNKEHIMIVEDYNPDTKKGILKIIS